MKRILIVMLALIALVNAPLFAADQILRVGAWTEAHNLNDLDTPGDIDYVVMPYAEYLFGRLSADRLTAGAYLNLNSPYEFGNGLDTVNPAVQGWLNYRLKNDPDSVMETGLFMYGTKSTSSGLTLSVDANFDWFPYNRLKEITAHEHYVDFHEGLRMGVGISGGVYATRLFEDGGPEKDLQGSLTGILKSGLRLGGKLWLLGDARVNFIQLAMPTTLESYEASSTGMLTASVSYVSDKIVLTAGVMGDLGVDKILTQNGFFDGSSFDYSWMLVSEAGYFFADDLYTYIGAELHSSKGSFAEYSALYIGAQYYLF